MRRLVASAALLLALAACSGGGGHDHADHDHEAQDCPAGQVLVTAHELTEQGERTTTFCSMPEAGTPLPPVSLP